MNPDSKMESLVTQSPEFALLVQAAGGTLAAASIPELGADDGFDWQWVADLADAHGLSARLGAMLQRQPTAAPAELLAALARESRANARRNLEFTQRLLRVLAALKEVGVPALAYKGPVLAEMLYGSHPLREFHDVDVLIQPHDWPRAKQCMIALGLAPNQQFTPAQEAAYVRSNNEMAFDGWGSRNWLELEWGIVPHYFSVDFRMNALITRAVEFPLAGMAVRTLSPEDMLLALAVHGSKHGWSRLCWVADIADLLRVRSLNWDVVAVEAQRLGIVRILLVALKLAATLNPEGVATAMAEIEREARPHRASGFVHENTAANRLAALFWRSLQSAPARYTADSWRFFWMMPRLRERWSDRLSFAWRLLATPETGEWNALALPDSLYVLYYPLRWLRLALKPLKMLLRRTRTQNLPPRR